MPLRANRNPWPGCVPGRNGPSANLPRSAPKSTIGRARNKANPHRPRASLVWRGRSNCRSRGRPLATTHSRPGRRRSPPPPPPRPDASGVQPYCPIRLPSDTAAMIASAEDRKTRTCAETRSHAAGRAVVGAVAITALASKIAPAPERIIGSPGVDESHNLPSRERQGTAGTTAVRRASTGATRRARPPAAAASRPGRRARAAGRQRPPNANRRASSRTSFLQQFLDQIASRSG